MAVSKTRGRKQSVFEDAQGSTDDVFVDSMDQKFSRKNVTSSIIWFAAASLLVDEQFLNLLTVSYDMHTIRNMCRLTGSPISMRDFPNDVVFLNLNGVSVLLVQRNQGVPSESCFCAEETLTGRCPQHWREVKLMDLENPLPSSEIAVKV
jgi:hypothetical protein